MTQSVRVTDGLLQQAYFALAAARGHESSAGLIDFQASVSSIACGALPNEGRIACPPSPRARWILPYCSRQRPMKHKLSLSTRLVWRAAWILLIQNRVLRNRERQVRTPLTRIQMELQQTIRLSLRLSAILRSSLVRLFAR